MLQQTSSELLMVSPIFYMVFLLVIGSLVLFVAALVTYLYTEDMGDDRVVWAIIIVLTGPIGSILWFVMGRPSFRKLSRLP